MITAVVVSSVLPSHPSTAIIDETIASIRHHLPDAEIILQLDGIREEQADRKADYTEYKKRVLWKCLHEWTNVIPVVFDEYSHQSTMMKATIDMIKTPLMLYVEGDCPLVTDYKIDWGECISLIMQGDANTIRYHFEAQVPAPHNHLMLKKRGNFLQTIQWSQRPHLSSVLYYRDVVLPYIPARNFIEDVFHGTIQQDYTKDGLLGWYKHRLWIYHPKGQIKRSYTTDGRQGGKKFTSDDEAWGL
jgi:hypothetical protein